MPPQAPQSSKLPAGYTLDAPSGGGLPPGYTLDQPQRQAAPEQFSQDRAVTDAWAQGHPILGPIARLLVSGGQNAANAITQTPGAIYHAITDAPTVEEMPLPYEQRVASRLLGAKQIAQAASDYASGKVTPKGAASVLPEALGAGLGQTTGGAAYGKLGGDILGVASDLPAGRITKATGAGIKAGLGKLPIVGAPTKAAILAIMKSWRESAPRTAPELISPSRTLPGMNPPEVTGRPTPAQPIGPRQGLLLPGKTEIPPSKVSSSAPESPTPISEATKAQLLSRLRSNAQNIQAQPIPSPTSEGPQTLIKGRAVPADTDLTPAMQESLDRRTQGRIMQVVRKEGSDLTVGMDRLMKDRGLQGISRAQVERSINDLGNAGKIHVHMKEADAHGPAGIWAIALKKKP